MNNGYKIPTQSFLPLYKNLYDGIKEKSIKNICPFFPQAGAKWGQSKIKILFIGRAVNGWIATLDEFKETLFDALANREDQMYWVEKLKGEVCSQDGKRRYNTNRSAFWALIKQICRELKIDPWYDYVAWSNMYKLSPYKGNPNRKFKKLQRDNCIEILKEEIKVLCPTHVIFVTRGDVRWIEADFFRALGLELSSMTEDYWNGNKILHSKLGEVTYIQTVRPEFRPIAPHANKIVDVILKN